MKERKRMVEPKSRKLSIYRQCDLLGISRSGFYYKPVGESEYNLRLMRKMDEIYLDYPFYGVLRMTAELRRREFFVEKKKTYRTTMSFFSPHFDLYA